MSFIFEPVAKLFGVDTKAQKRLAQAQAQALSDQAAQTVRQSQAIADQAAQQVRLTQERNRVQEQVTAMEKTQPDTAPTIQLTPDDASASRRRRQYQTGSAVRI